jgi:hypothetical protein
MKEGIAMTEKTQDKRAMPGPAEDSAFLALATH